MQCLVLSRLFPYITPKCCFRGHAWQDPPPVLPCYPGMSAGLGSKVGTNQTKNGVFSYKLPPVTLLLSLATIQCTDCN